MTKLGMGHLVAWAGRRREVDGLGLIGVGEKGKSRVNPGLEVGWLGAVGHRGYWGLQVCGSGRRGSPVWGILGSGCHETLHAGADLGLLTV